jgi:drug/metabolite transporter (DMT)-like permease
LTLGDPSIGAGRRARDLGRRYPLVLIAVGTVLYATGPVMVAASEVSGPVFSFWRLWFGVGAFGIATVVGRLRGEVTERAAWRWSRRSGLAFGIHQLLLFSALKLASVADVTLVNTIAPIVTGLLAVPLFGERAGRDFWAWGVVAMSGAVVVVVGATGGPTGSGLGMFLASTNVVFFSLFFLASKKSRDHLGVIPFLFGVMLMAALTVSAYVIVAGEAVTSVTRADVVLAAVVAVGPGFLGHVVMTWPLRWVPANVPPLFRLAQPAFAATFAWWFLGQTVTWWHPIGGLIVIAGTAGAVRSRSGRALLRGDRPTGRWT